MLGAGNEERPVDHRNSEGCDQGKDCPKVTRRRVQGVLSSRGVPSNPVQVWVEITYQSNPTMQAVVHQVNMGTCPHRNARTRHAKTVVATNPAVRRTCVTRGHIRTQEATEGCPGCKGFETGKSMPHKNACRLKIAENIGQDKEGRDGLKREHQRQERHDEGGIARSVEHDP